MEKSEMKLMDPKKLVSEEETFSDTGAIPAPKFEEGEILDTEVLPSYTISELLAPPKFKNSNMYVSGYDTLLPEDAIISAVSKHFSSCGEIVDVVVVDDDDVKSGICLVTISGDRATEKAVALSGCKCDVEGCKIVVDCVIDDSSRESTACGNYVLPEWLLPPKDDVSVGSTDSDEEYWVSGGERGKLVMQFMKEQQPNQLSAWCMGM